MADCDAAAAKTAAEVDDHLRMELEVMKELADSRLQDYNDATTQLTAARQEVEALKLQVPACRQLCAVSDFPLTPPLSLSLRLQANSTSRDPSLEMSRRVMDLSEELATVKAQLKQAEMDRSAVADSLEQTRTKLSHAMTHVELSDAKLKEELEGRVAAAQQQADMFAQMVDELRAQAKGHEVRTARVCTDTLLLPTPLC